ncbi:hypothetical protein ABZ470_09615 [Streptosporangium sp. NPDC020072]|uniref:hypothetical protein n=1 Tax=Streptosporangium sp. NPDC020072 TaxID=3154788 RepID=UPI003427309A
MIWWKVVLVGVIALPTYIALSVSDGERGWDLLARSAPVIVILVLSVVLAIREYRAGRQKD